MKHPNYLPLIGLVLLILGIWLRCRINSRKFKRRAITGIELFPNYLNKEVTRIEGGGGKLLGGILIFFGIVLILA